MKETRKVDEIEIMSSPKRSVSRSVSELMSGTLVTPAGSDSNAMSSRVPDSNVIVTDLSPSDDSTFLPMAIKQANAKAQVMRVNDSKTNLPEPDNASIHNTLQEPYPGLERRLSKSSIGQRAKRLSLFSIAQVVESHKKESCTLSEDQIECLEIWNKACQLQKEGKDDDALEVYLEAPAPSAKMFFNMAKIRALQNDHYWAVKIYQQALSVDPFLAVAYFELGNSKFQLDFYEEAVDYYSSALELLLENDFIDYSQLGLSFQLYRSEIEYNIAQAYIASEDEQVGFMFLKEAEKHCKSDKQAEMIKTAFNSDHGFTGIYNSFLFSVDATLHFQPPPSLITLIKEKYNVAKEKALHGQKKVDFHQPKNTVHEVGFSGEMLARKNTNIMKRTQSFVLSMGAELTVVPKKSVFQEWMKWIVLVTSAFLIVTSGITMRYPYPTYSFSTIIDPFLGPEIAYSPSNAIIDVYGTSQTVPPSCMAHYNPIYNLTYPTPNNLILFNQSSPECASLELYQPHPWAPSQPITGPSLPLSAFVGIGAGLFFIFVEGTSFMSFLHVTTDGFKSRAFMYMTVGFYVTNQIASVQPGVLLMMVSLMLIFETVVLDMADGWF